MVWLIELLFFKLFVKFWSGGHLHTLVFYCLINYLLHFQHGVEFVAEHVLPLLIPLLIDQQLNVQQFAKYMLFVKDIVRNSHVALIKLYMAMISLNKSLLECPRQ
ncbi:uncharacterized protein LOC126631834 isoform X4 [Malus sylvestris]|uniref:uncharacterized protein LOC126631834 isoform X4 n=1 Tax=Malus sylvestris TaxID=3752 RepID=UPI0021AB9FCA|nr:uncharacterized protein LOC126631834 isoform X4 [Malus sylvestris]